MKKVIISTLIVAGLSSSLFAKSYMQKTPEMAKKVKEVMGETSPYYRAKKENFPKDYFLVNQNLPFMVGVILFHPQGDKLNLTKEQLAKFKEMKDTIVPASMKVAKQIKAKELKLTKDIIEDKKDPKELSAQVDEIAKLRADLTKAHLDCIHQVQGTLSKEQFNTLLELIKSKNKK